MLSDYLKKIRKEIRGRLLKEPVFHNDETNMNMSGKNWWGLVASNELLTYLTPYNGRDYEAMVAADFLTQYKGITVLDCLATYKMFNQLSGHCRCCAHILRDLQKVIDTQKEHVWTRYLQQTLLDMKVAKERAIAKGKKCISFTIYNTWWNIWKDTEMKCVYFLPILLCPLTTIRLSVTSGMSKLR